MTNRLFLFILLVSSAAHGQFLFDGVTKWEGFLKAKDPGSLATLYSKNPPARFMDQKSQPSDITSETGFWTKTLSSGATALTVTPLNEEDQQNLHIVKLEVSMKVKTPAGPRTRYVLEQQAWQDQGGTWRIVLASHTDVLRMRPAVKLNPHLYEPNADAKLEIKDALAQAARNHQRVILVFGGNWCYDCHVLDQAFHDPDIAPLVQKNFQVVHVDIGDDGEKNSDLAQKYDIPVARGVPALAVLASDGKLLYSQKNHEFSKARALDPDLLIAFLNKWKP
jgi:thiol-disulfide isomerase/thioredoxin